MRPARTALLACAALSVVLLAGLIDPAFARGRGGGDDGGKSSGDSGGDSGKGRGGDDGGGSGNSGKGGDDGGDSGKGNDDGKSDDDGDHDGDNDADKADDDSDDDAGKGRNRNGRQVLSQDEARRGVARGELVPLSKVLKTVGAARPGTVVAVDLVRANERARPVYEISVVGADGAFARVLVDARRNKILATRRR